MGRVEMAGKSKYGCLDTGCRNTHDEESRDNKRFLGKREKRGRKVERAHGEHKSHAKGGLG